tara:strand:+ start:2354 stop:2500 length:147 start_codon:yes stop_codon:yes gene_type:complete
MGILGFVILAVLAVIIATVARVFYLSGLMAEATDVGRQTSPIEIDTTH